MNETILLNQLESLANWQLVSQKKVLTKRLVSLLRTGEEVRDLLEGFYTSSALKGSAAGLAGCAFLTAERLVFVSSEKNASESVALDTIIDASISTAYSSLKLIFKTAQKEILLRTFISKRRAGQFLSHLNSEPSRLFSKEVHQSKSEESGETLGQNETQGYDYLNAFDILSTVNPISTFSKRVSSFLENVSIEKKPQPANEKSHTKRGEALATDFLFIEAKRIYEIVEPLLGDEALRNAVMRDLSSLGALVSMSNESLEYEEAFFFTLLLFLVHDNRASKVSRDILSSSKFPYSIDEFLLDHNDLTLKLLDYSSNSESENFLSSFTTARTQLVKDETACAKLEAGFSTFVQVMAKADGSVSEKKRHTIETLQKYIFNNQLLQQETEVESYADTQIEESEERLEDVLAELEQLVGMDNVKEEIATFINVIKIRQEREKHKLPITPLSLHSVFYGPPGTGKTTIARLVGRIFKCLGLLKRGHLVETDRAGLVAGYVGQTAAKTDEMVKKSLDGILFIDEAYTLAGGSQAKDFGQEAVDTILKRMEDYRERFVVIVAGYPQQMKEFIHSNPGLKSRFSRYFYFDHYTPKELSKIFQIFAKNSSFTISSKARKRLEELFSAYYDEKDKTFGNGRLVRNLFEKTLEYQANRLAQIGELSATLLSTIEVEDVPKKEDVLI